jgi:hypothetical protein
VVIAEYILRLHPCIALQCIVVWPIEVGTWGPHIVVVGNLHKLEWVDADGCPLKRYWYTQRKVKAKNM